MAKHNYTSYSKASNKPVENHAPGPTEPVILMSKSVEVADPVDPATAEPVVAVVANCSRLNVREEPSMTADILTTLVTGTELRIIEKIDGEPSFYKICAACGLEGFCVCDYITIKA